MMRAAIRSLGVVILALASTVAVAAAWTTAAAVQLLATALIMGGSDHPLSTPPDTGSYVSEYLSNAVGGYINTAAALPTGTGENAIPSVGEHDARYAVVYPADFFPVFGTQTLDTSVSIGRASLNGCLRGTPACNYNKTIPKPQPAPDPTDEFVIFGYSQSAIVASLVKRDLLQKPEQVPTNASFFLLANPMRPNGGILARGPQGLTIPILGVTFSGATPTNSCDLGNCMPTVDVAAQYDGMGGDAPASLTNVLAILNAAAGYYYEHGNLQYGKFDGALYQGSYGDTDYYLLPAQRLPILKPFQSFIPSPILTALDAPLRVLIEGAYARDVNPGIATKVGLLPFRDPIQTAINLLKAIPTGIDDALAEAAGNPSFRPLGTAPVTSPFGVGGPQLPAPPTGDTGVNAMRTSMTWSASDNHDAAGLVAGNEPVEQQPSGEPRKEHNDAVVEEPKGTVVEESKGTVVEEHKGTVVDEHEGTVVDEHKGTVVDDPKDEPKDGDVVKEQKDDADVVKPAPTTAPKPTKARGPARFDSREPTKPRSHDETRHGQPTTGEPHTSDDSGAHGAEKESAA
jgi:hypothetical protein